MKITNQTADELMLKEGDAKSIVIGIILILAGVGIGFYIHFAVSNPLWVALGLLVVGLVVAFMSSSIGVAMSKTNGQIMYQTKRLIGGKTAMYSIGDVLRIETRKSWQMENNNSGGRGGFVIGGGRGIGVNCKRGAEQTHDSQQCEAAYADKSKAGF